MPSTGTLRKTKLTVTIGGDVVNELDGIAKEKGTLKKLGNGRNAARLVAEI